ncbi:MAG: DUF4179 domain-containing protein [Oscillospiraceae bacterium]|nr:DUF4179 domain-containing protein [Oscillospiraceae bacterium]
MNSQFEYKSAMDSLHFTGEQKRRIAENAAGAAARQTRRARRPIGKTVLIAACIAAVLAVSAGASGVLKTAVESFSGIFGSEVAQTEVIGKIGRPIGASATDNGVTISADAIIGDAYNAAVVFTIRRDDGTRLFPEEVSEKNLLMGGFGGVDMNIRGGSHGSSWFVDEDPDDDSVQMVYTISADVPLSRGTAKADFSDLCGWDDETGESVPLIEGRWKFRFDVDYEDSSVVLGGGETFEQDGMTFTIDEIRVSPVAVRVAYTADSEVRWSDAPSGRISEEDRESQRRYFENVEILLTRTDGTVASAPTGGSIKPDNGQTLCVKGGVLDEIIPLEELQSISVGGIVYPISAE